MASFRNVPEQGLLFPLKTHTVPAPTRLRTVGLFAGIGGLELGLHQAGAQTQMLCEIDPHAQQVLKRRFDAPIVGDIRELNTLPACDVLTGGFPCKNVSSSNRKQEGLQGAQTGLVTHIFRLLRENTVPYVVLENVEHILNMNQGEVMHYVTQSLEELGYRWAYRLLDSRAFGLPQRRRRVYFVASRTSVLPEEILFADDAVFEDPEHASAYGFTWQDGMPGIGWAPNCLPTIRCGSALGVASPPALWNVAKGEMGTIALEDAERLQGFPAGWTSAAGKIGERWRQVGNAASVPVSSWIARRILNPGTVERLFKHERVRIGKPKHWPTAASMLGEIEASTFPMLPAYGDVLDFLQCPLKPLTFRQASGFLKRIRASQQTMAHRMNFTSPIRQAFLRTLEQYADPSRNEQSVRRKEETR